LVSGVLVIVIVAVADLRGAIGFSSFAVLTYYALTNAASWTLTADQRRWPRWLTVTGLLGCIVLALTLPREVVLGGILLLAVGSWQPTIGP
jgi:APA family basic amino acid/polyamine antiporter